MLTIKKIIERVDRKINNAYNDETKLEMIASLDGKIAMDVMLMDIAEMGNFCYSFPEDLEKQPLVKFPYDDLYDRWIAAQIAALDEEWDRYSNLMELYNAYFEEYANWFISTYRPGQGKMGDGRYMPGVVSYYLTAYGLAMMQGFSGTLDEWLASLKGEKGDQGIPGMKLAGVQVEMLPEDREPYARMGGTDDAPIMYMGIPKQSGDYLPRAGGSMLGNIRMGGNAIRDLADPVEPGDAVRKGYIETLYATDAPKAAGSAAVGISEKLSRSDHVHPAGVATKLETPIPMRVHLNKTESSQFDGSEAATIGVTGKLGGENGGTGIQLSDVPPYAILRKHGTAGTNMCHYTSTRNGAMYATSQNGNPVFGTLPIEQGGTGATTAEAAFNKLGQKGGGVAGNMYVYGKYFPLFSLRTSEKGEDYVRFTYNHETRNAFFSVFNADMDGVANATRYAERYLLPLADAGLKSNQNYFILTTKKAVGVDQGGTGARNAADARENLGLGSKCISTTTVRWGDSGDKKTTFQLTQGNLFVVVGRMTTNGSVCSVTIPKVAISASAVKWQLADNQGYLAFNISCINDTATIELVSGYVDDSRITAIYGVF